jgi:hypothetical protein
VEGKKVALSAAARAGTLEGATSCSCKCQGERWAGGRPSDAAEVEGLSGPMVNPRFAEVKRPSPQGQLFACSPRSGRWTGK